jgi:hypothetical protein
MTSDAPAPAYTPSHIATAADLAIELLFDDPQVSLTTRDRDLLTLAVNAIQTVLANPAATLEQVITSCYDTGPEEVLSWLRR